jgi:hypothetical protein
VRQNSCTASHALLQWRQSADHWFPGTDLSTSMMMMMIKLCKDVCPAKELAAVDTCVFGFWLPRLLMRSQGGCMD